MTQLIMIGFMGAGKTTVGRLLAQTLSVPFCDLDEQLQVKLGMSLADYFATEGETSFREEERGLLKKAMSKPGIISTGGGIVTLAQTRQLLLASTQVVYLKTDPVIALERIQQDQSTIRPLANTRTNEEMFALYQERAPYYEACSTWTIETSNVAPVALVTEIIKLLT